MRGSSIDASNILRKNVVNVGKSTIYNILKKDSLEIDYSKPTIVCLDDFTLKKRHTYGSILIDMKTRKIIDLIESRELKDVAAWLKKFKNLKFVNRDGSETYAKAIFQTHPKAIQIIDYFHLLKNLCDYLKDT